MKRMRHFIILLFVLFWSTVQGLTFSTTPNTWGVLVEETNKMPSDFSAGSWDTTYWNGPGSPGRPVDFLAWGLKLKTSHPEFYATINEHGELVKPGYVDEKHRGKYSVDYPELLRATKEIADLKLMPTVGLFLHNFETIEPCGLEKFFRKFNNDLKKMKVKQMVLILAWDIQGDWPAWEDGATRDCFIDPGIFNQQMKFIKKSRDKAVAKNILLGIALAAGFDDRHLNKQNKTGADYTEGLRQCDIIGINYYPTKDKGPKAAFEDAKKLWTTVGGNKLFAFFEYSIGNYDYINNKPIGWSEDEKIGFIRETYRLVSDYPFVKQIHWWFIGRGNEARIRYPN